MLFTTLLVSAVSVNALQMTYYSDANCANNAHSADVQYDTCNKIYEGDHTTVQSMKITSANTSQPINGTLYNQNDCSGTATSHQFREGECLKVSDYASYNLYEPEQFGVGFYYFLGSDDCSGDPSVLYAYELPQKFPNDNCEQPASIKPMNSSSYPANGVISLRQNRCSKVEKGMPLGDGEYIPDWLCIPLQDTTPDGQYKILQTYELDDANM